MKKLNILSYIFAIGILTLSSCDDFLDKMPDARAEIDTEDKVTKLLVSAYANCNGIVMEEMSSDNAMDNGSNYDVEYQVHEEAYLWKDITDESGDNPSDLWNACYTAVATANQALASIEELGNPASLQPERGEALLCRAWGMFQLSNVFCLAYNPTSATSDLGLPYPTEPETTVSPQYERGTMEELYANIAKDIEEGLPLINDKIYDVPKYHFNRKAAYAFAARFYLYYQKWDKCIAAANEVLGANPTTIIRKWANIYNLASNFETRCNAYTSLSEPSNLLLQTAASSMVYWLGPYNLSLRYGHNHTNIAKVETYRTDGIWGKYGSASDLYMSHSCWGFDQKICYSKYIGYFEYSDKVNGTGTRWNNIVQLCADETLLCRAEAYTIKGDYANAMKDINYWLSTNSRTGLQVTQQDVIDVYGENMKYMEDADQKPIVASADNGSPKKRLHPLGFTIADDTQECFIHCILHMRRCQTIQEGLRWMDIKRWGIEIAHNREGQPADQLLLNDPRRAIQLPQDVISAGLTPNPRNK